MTAATARADVDAPEQTGPARPPRLLRGRPTTWADAITGALIGLVVTAFAFVYRSPIVPTDPWHYVRSALEFPSDAWVPLGFTRYGIILATIPPAYVFKNAQASYYFWPLLTVFLLAASVYLVGRRFWGPVAGVVAVVVLFSNSVILYNLTRGYPDLMSMALLFCAAFCALMARDRGFRGRAAVLWLLATGFLLGWGFEVRETFLFAWPFVLALLWKRGSVLRTYLIVAAPVLFWAALDVGISGLVYGDPLLKLHTLLGTNPTGVGNAPPPSPFADSVQGKTRWEHFLSLPQAALTSPDGVWMVVIGAVSVLAVAVRNRPMRVVAGSFVLVYGLNLLAGGVAVPDHPFGALVNKRYWIQYFPFIALVIGGLVSLGAAWLIRRARLESTLARGAVVGALVVAACAVPVWHAARYVPTVPAFAANGGDSLEELRSHLEGSGFAPEVVWTDWETKRLLPAYQRPFFGGDKVWTGKARSLTGPGEPQSGDAVLLFSARGNVCDHCRRALEPWLEENPTVPETWDLVYEDPVGEVELYVVR